jgi:hypothetical protein
MKIGKLRLLLLLIVSFGIIPRSIAQKFGCSTVQPSTITPFDTSNTRGLADNYYLWENGATIYVKIMDGSPQLQQAVMTISKEWEQYANIKFVYITSGASNIRVNLDNKGGHNSLVGTLCNMAKQTDHTINFDTTDFVTYESMHGTVLHEFGHALGLLHEHSSPIAGIPWNKEAVYADLKATQGWDKDMVDAQLFEQMSLSYTNGTSYDNKSIMHYPILAKWTTNGYSVSWNNVLSQGDKDLISALYPRLGNRAREVPRFVVYDYKDMQILNSPEKKGLIMYPTCLLTTAGKEGRVYFSVFFYDEAGHAIQAPDGSNYNISKIVATYRSGVLKPDLKVGLNWQGVRDFELFIPYSAFPLPSGSNNVKAVFKVFLVDGDEFKLLYSSDAIPFSMIK